MKFKMFVTALMLGLALPAAADFVTIVEGYEVSMSNVRLPQSESGTIAFKKCSDCLYETKRVTAETIWEINGEATTLEKFRLRLSTVDKKKSRTVTVGHHLERDVIVKVTTWIH